MRVKFREKTLNIENLSNKNSEFYAEWNYFTIEIFQNDKRNYADRERWKDHRYYVCVSSPMGSYIVDGSEYPTQLKCLQCAFDNIDIALREMENMVSEKCQLIESGEETNEDIKEVEYWLSEMRY